MHDFIQLLCFVSGLRSVDRKLRVCVVCLSNNRVDAITNLVSDEYGRHEKFNLEINSLDNLYEKWYDVVILSTVVENKSELPKGKRINTSLTRSRHILEMCSSLIAFVLFCCYY